MRSAGSHLAPARVVAQRHERGFQHYLSADNGGGEIVDARGRRLGWWMLRPAGVVSGPRADRLGTDRRLVPPEADSNWTQDDDATTRPASLPDLTY